MINKIMALCLVAALVVSSSVREASAEEEPHPGSFTYIEEGMPERNLHGPVWCYDNEANIYLLMAVTRERGKCELRLTYEIEKEKIKSKLRIDNLELRISSLKKEQTSILSIKDKEIERLTEIATRIPNDHSLWWASGGVAVGVITTVLIVFAVNR